MPLSDEEIRVLLERARSYTITKDENLPGIKQALEIYNRLTKDAPLNPYYFSEMAEVKFRLSIRIVKTELFDSAIEDIKYAIQLDPNNGSYYARYGNILLYDLAEDADETKTKIQDTIEVYKSCIHRTPTLSEAWLALIALNIIINDLDNAISCFGQCKLYINSKKDQLVRSYLGCLSFILAGDPLEEDDMKPLFDQSIKLDYVDTREYLIASKIKKCCIKDDTYSTITHIVKILANHYENAIHKGEIFRSMGMNTHALEAYDDAVIVDENNKYAWRFKGKVLLDSFRYQEAVDAFAKAITLDPDNSSMLNYNFGKALYKKGRYEEAIIAFNGSIDFVPDTDKFVWIGCSLLWLKRYNEALNYFNKALNLEPDNIDALYDKGLVLKALGLYKEAIEVFSKVLQEYPSYINAKYAKVNIDSMLDVIKKQV